MAKYLELRAIEGIVRQLLQLPHPPVVLLLSVRDWCDARSDWNPWLLAEMEARRVCARYGQTCISVHDALEPMLRVNELGFSLGDIVSPNDCLHPMGSRNLNGAHRIAEMLAHAFDMMQSVWLQGGSSLSGKHQTGPNLPSALPRPIHAQNSAASAAARCFEFRKPGVESSSGVSHHPPHRLIADA